jgi:hypothetical protein
MVSGGRVHLGLARELDLALEMGGRACKRDPRAEAASRRFPILLELLSGARRNVRPGDVHLRQAARRIDSGSGGSGAIACGGWFAIFSVSCMTSSASDRAA